MAKKNEPTDGFDEVLKHIETLPDIKKKLVYLIEEKTRWDQKNSDFWPGLGVLSFSEKCGLEINKYKELAKLEGRNNGKAKELLKEIDRRPLRGSGVPGFHTRDQLAELDLVGLKKKAELQAEQDFKAEMPKQDEVVIPGKFTIKQIMVLLDYLSPDIFARATHKVKAQFILKLSAHDSPSIDKIENMFSRANFDEIKQAEDGILGLWKENLLPSAKGRRQS